MGSRIVSLLDADPGMTLFRAFEAGDAPEAAIDGADVLIDFTSPVATVEHARLAARLGVALVIGTTGLSSDDQRALDEAAKIIPILVSPNMSVGVTLLCRILPMIAKTFGSDIEIVEAHHGAKKDSPSGTALRLRDAVQPARDHAIPVHAIRGGDVVGDHTVHFLAHGERIEITHRATSRDTFALGSIRAARFIVGKPPGRYAMEDVLDG